MKRRITILAIAFLLVNVAHAGGTTKENCGCGLGTLAFEGEDDLFSQIIAASANQIISSNQIFGITSGTLRCKRPGTFLKNERLSQFVSENMDNLATEMASGQGESLETLAELAEIPVEKRADFFVALQENFDAIYPSPQVTHVSVVEKIIDIIGQI